MTQKVKSLDNACASQQENLYNIEFQIQGLERKVAPRGRAGCDRTRRAGS